MAEMKLPELRELRLGSGQISNKGMRHLSCVSWPKLEVFEIGHSFFTSGLNLFDKDGLNYFTAL